jgi:spermidine synthase
LIAPAKRVSYALAAAGFTAVVGQVLLMRELVATFYGNELIFGLVLAVWLAWGALGAFAAGRAQGGMRLVVAGLLLAAITLPSQLLLVRSIRSFLGVVAGAHVEFLPMVASICLLPAPLCLLLGGIFSVAARMLPDPKSGSRVYLWESFGSALGGGLFSFVFVHWLDPVQTALLVSGLDLTVAVLLLFPRSLIPTVLMLIAVPFGALPLGGHLHSLSLAWQWSDLVHSSDTPYGRITVVSRESQRAFFENGLLAFETQSSFQEQVVHFPLLAHPDPRSVLLIGGGVGGDLREMLRHQVEQVVYVELDPGLIESARQHLSAQDAAVLQDPRVQLVADDGRRYVQRSEVTFDVVVLDLPEPSTGAINRFYTQEFFLQVRNLLSPGGVASLGLPASENYWSSDLARRNGSVYWTLREVWSHVLVLPGEHNFFLASDQPLPNEPEPLVQRLEERSIGAQEMTPAYIEYVYATDRFTQVQSELAGMAEVRRNHDRWPICYYYDLVLWLSRFYSGLRPIFERAALISSVWFTLPLVGLVVLGRLRRSLAVPLVILLVGLAQMSLQVLIIFAFQVGHGTLYGHVSLVVTGFMLGLTTGALAGRLMTQRARPWLLIDLAGTGVLALILAVLPLGAGEVVYLGLALAAGVLGGAAFPLALGLSDAGAGQLYASDLVGGSIGALLTAAFAVPVLGLTQTAVIVVLVGLAGLFLLL